MDGGMTTFERKERPLKMAARDHVPVRRPAWWSSRAHGIPLDYTGRPSSSPAPLPHHLMLTDKAAKQLEDRKVPGVLSRRVREQTERRLLHEEMKVPRERIEEVERTLIDKVSWYTPFHEKPESILIRAFQTFDREHRGTITAEAFQSTLQCFQVSVGLEECRVLFRKYGQDTQRRLPYAVFTRALLSKKSRLLAWPDAIAPRGVPFAITDTTAKQKLARTFDAKIQHADVKRMVTGMYPPSWWGESRPFGKAHPLVRARKPPDGRLELEHVYGYAGKTGYINLKLDPLSSVVSNNLYFTSSKEVVYYTAAVGIVLNIDEPTNLKQRFFQSHDDDILCLALDESRNYAATGQTAPLKRTKGQDVRPTVSVWCVHSMQELMQLEHEPMEALPGEETALGGIQAVAFSEDGSMLISCCRDMRATIFIWKWRKREVLFRQHTKQGVPPQCFGIKWNPWEVCPCKFASFGVKHINFWDSEKGGGWSFEPGSFLKKQDPAKRAGEKSDVEVQDVLCVEFLPTNGNVVTGMSSGDMYIWKPAGTAKGKGSKATPGFQCERRVLTQTDPKKPPSRAHHNALQVLVVRAERKRGSPAHWSLISGGGGGKIKIWGNLEGEIPKLVHEIELPRGPPSKHRSSAPKGAGGSSSSKPPGVKSLDCWPGSNEMVVGTDKCDVYKIKLTGGGGKGEQLTAEPTLLVKGHNYDVNGLAKHPNLHSVFVTTCRSDKMYIWEATIKGPVGEATLPGKLATAVAFRPDALHIAVGTTDGAVYIFKELNDWKEKTAPPKLTKVQGMQSWPIRDCISEISELKYSPDSSTLAVASHDQFVDLYDAEATTGSDGRQVHRYVRLRRCVGHSSTVSHVDWSVDSKLMQTQCNAYELLYWDTDRAHLVWNDAKSSEGTRVVNQRRSWLYGKQVRDSSRIDEIRDTSWATWSCKLGFNVMGIWPPDYKNDDINFVDCSPMKLVGSKDEQSDVAQYLACADDRGGVLLYNYPTVVDQQPYDYYNGHSSHVSNVKWLMTEDKLLLISAGGHDRSLFQWRFVLDNSNEPKPDGLDPEPPLALPAPMTKTSASEPRAAETAAEPPPPPPLQIGSAAEGAPSARRAARGGAVGGASALRSDSRLQQEERIREQEAKLREQGTLIEQLQRRLLELEQSRGK
ncbi:hypothetical protein AB1Y20_008120 [Prymnesium parvum]|uniref:EF-hand domain-containing protein n=1 Tax=Prymnesium parvum TaxID=97485 RepID=A0AB34ITU5_PRYPA